MSISFFQGKLSSEQRRDILHFVQQQVNLAALEAIRTVIQECLEAEVTTKLGREKGAPRKEPQERWVKCVRSTGPAGTAGAKMPINSHEMAIPIGTRDPGWGHVRNLRVPMLECQICYHDVICHFAVFEKNQRFWLDLDQDALFSSGLCQSLCLNARRSAL